MRLGKGPAVVERQKREGNGDGEYDKDIIIQLVYECIILMHSCNHICLWYIYVHMHHIHIYAHVWQSIPTNIFTEHSKLLISF